MRRRCWLSRFVGVGTYSNCTCTLIVHSVRSEIYILVHCRRNKHENNNYKVDNQRLILFEIPLVSSLLFIRDAYIEILQYFQLLCVSSV